MFDIVKSFLDQIITTDFVDDSGDELHGRLILLGGLQINMPSPMDDHFLPLGNSHLYIKPLNTHHCVFSTSFLLSYIIISVLEL